MIYLPFPRTEKRGKVVPAVNQAGLWESTACGGDGPGYPVQRERDGGRERRTPWQEAWGAGWTVQVDRQGVSHAELGGTISGGTGHGEEPPAHKGRYTRAEALRSAAGAAATLSRQWGQARETTQLSFNFMPILESSEPGTGLPSRGWPRAPFGPQESNSVTPRGTRKPLSLDLHSY